FTGDNQDYIIPLTTPATVAPGMYWVSAVGTITVRNWFWDARSITNNTYASAFRNPGDGYGTGCTGWARLTTCDGVNFPDQVFRLVGNITGLTPTPTPTASPTPTPTPTTTPNPCDSGIIQNAGFETGSFPPWVIQDTHATPAVTNTLSHSGIYSGFL